MTYQKHIIPALALFFLALGASVQSRADGLGTEAPPAKSAAQNKTFPCAWHLWSCVAAVWTSQATAHPAIRQGLNENASSRLALDTGVAEVSEQASDKPAFGESVNFTVASLGSETDTHKGRWALNMMLDNTPHGTIFNSIAPLEAMQVSLNYTHAW